MSSHDVHAPAMVKIPGRIKLMAVITAVCALMVVTIGIHQRHSEALSLKNMTEENSVLTVGLVNQQNIKSSDTLVLPGMLQAYVAASIYARVPGYLKSWNVDIGTKVRAGQVLAEIDTPELDQQLAQAEANLDTSRANFKLAELTARRWQSLLKNDSVSQQETDEKIGDANAKNSIMLGMQANVDRLRAMQSFKRVTAPFSGVVTSRKTDIGDLINGGSQTGKELFTVADVHKLRLYVNTPQNYVSRIRTGMVAKVEVATHPGESFAARVVSDSRSVNEASGTLLVQLEMENADGRLLPADFANVSFKMIADQHARQLPSSAILFRPDGPHVAVVNAENRVALYPIRIGRDLGPSVEIIGSLDGLKPDERIIDLPPEILKNNDEVRVKEITAISVSAGN